jgi:hypothetical protein
MKDKYRDYIMLQGIKCALLKISGMGWVDEDRKLKKLA